MRTIDTICVYYIHTIFTCRTSPLVLCGDFIPKRNQFGKLLKLHYATAGISVPTVKVLSRPCLTFTLGIQLRHGAVYNLAHEPE